MCMCISQSPHLHKQVHNAWYSIDSLRETHRAAAARASASPKAGWSSSGNAWRARWPPRWTSKSWAATGVHTITTTPGISSTCRASSGTTSPTSSPTRSSRVTSVCAPRLPRWSGKTICIWSVSSARGSTRKLQRRERSVRRTKPLLRALPPPPLPPPVSPPPPPLSLCLRLHPHQLFPPKTLHQQHRNQKRNPHQATSARKSQHQHQQSQRSRKSDLFHSSTHTIAFKVLLFECESCLLSGSSHLGTRTQSDPRACVSCVALSGH